MDSSGRVIFVAEEFTDASAYACCRGTGPFNVSLFIRSGVYRKEANYFPSRSFLCNLNFNVKLFWKEVLIVYFCILTPLGYEVEWRTPKLWLWRGKKL